MADACMNPGSLQAVVDHDAMGFGDVLQAARDGALHSNALKWAIEADAADAAKNRLAESFADVMKNSVGGGPEPTATEAAEIRRMGNRLQSTIDRAEKGMEARLANTQDLIEWAANTAAGDVGPWMNFKNRMYNVFVSDRGSLHKWIAAAGRMPGVETFRNKIVTAFEGMTGRQNAALEDFDRRRQNFLAKLVPYANRCKSAMDVEDFAQCVGNYAPAMHAPERNAKLLERWRGEMQQAISDFKKLSPRQQQNAEKISELKYFLTRKQTDIDMLTRNLDRSVNDLPEAEAARLRTCGYTNEDARRAMQKIVDETGLSHEDFRTLSGMLSDEFKYVLDRRADAGCLSPELIASFPEFENYVPMLGRHMIEGNGNTTGAANDCTAYNPGTYYAMEGSVGNTPDSAWSTLGYYHRRAAMEIGSVNFGEALNALYNRLRSEGDTKHMLRRIPYDEMIAKMNSEYSATREAYDQMYRNGGMVASVVENGELKKYFFNFDNGKFDYRGGDFDGASLNRALSSSFNLDNGGKPLELMGKATSTMGMLVTRFTPTFAIVSAIRDVWERGLNMPQRDFYGPNGETIRGGTALAQFLSNIGTAADLLYKGVRGQLDPNSFEGQIYREFREEGLHMAFAKRGQIPNKTVEELFGMDNASVRKRIGMESPKFNKFMNSLGQSQTAVLRTLDGWNDYFQNISGFTEFYTLRKMGVNRLDAADATRTEMNLHQRGSMAPWLQMLAPFVAPTVQSGLAMARSMGMGKDTFRETLRAAPKGAVPLVATASVVSLLMPLIESSLGNDPNGTKRADALTLDELSRNIPVGIGGGDYFKIPIGFGWGQLGSLVAWGMDRVKKGTLHPSDFLFEVAYSGFKNMSPGGWPEYRFSEDPMAYVMHMITPQFAKPFAELASNRSTFGSEIYNVATDSEQSLANLGRTSTPRRYHEAAKWMRNYLGIDIQPERYKYLEQSYLTGPLRMLTLMANSVDDVYKGSSCPTALQSLPPPLAALGVTYFYGKQNNPALSMYYTAKNEFDSRIREQGIKMTGAKDGESAADHRRQALVNAGWADADIDDYIKIYETGQTLRKQSSEWNANWKDRWLAMDSSSEVRQAFKELFDQNVATYADTVNSLNYFRRR